MADCAGEPPAAVERQQPGRYPEIDRVPKGTADRKRRRRLHQRFVFTGVWIVGRTEHSNVGDRIDEATHRPRAGLVPEGGEERSVGALLGPEKALGRREGRQAVRGRDDEALAGSSTYRRP